MILITQIRLIEGSNDADLYLSRESNKYFNGANLLASTFHLPVRIKYFITN